VPARLSPTERIRAQIDELFAGGQPLAETLEEAARLSVRLVIQAALEAEVSEFLGRNRYQRDPDAGPGYRNGHQPVEVKTTAGPVVLERPKLRSTSEPFVSRLLGKGVSRTNALEALVLASFVRGLSVRDVEAVLAEALGPEAALSKSTVCRICQVIKEEFDAFTARDLGGVEVDYLFLDGAHFRYHPGAPAEPILVAWGVTTTGGPVLLGLGPGSHEGTDPWAGFLEELAGRGLAAPLLVITDGAPGLISAVELAFPRSLRQRCLIHRARNVLAKVPTHAQAEVKAAFWGIFDGIDAPPGDQAVAEARRRADAFADRYQHRYPAAVGCLTDTLPELTVFLRFPLAPMSSGGCLIVGLGGAGIGQERPVDHIGQAPLQGPDRLGGGVAVGAAAGQVALGVRVVASLGQRDAVQRQIQLPVTGTAEPVALLVA
jgi:putative transposase